MASDSGLFIKKHVTKLLIEESLVQKQRHHQWAMYTHCTDVRATIDAVDYEYKHTITMPEQWPRAPLRSQTIFYR